MVWLYDWKLPDLYLKWDMCVRSFKCFLKLKILAIVQMYNAQVREKQVQHKKE